MTISNKTVRQSSVRKMIPGATMFEVAIGNKKYIHSLPAFPDKKIT
jgi:hypothetical protein